VIVFLAGCGVTEGRIFLGGDVAGSDVPGVDAGGPTDAGPRDAGFAVLDAEGPPPYPDATFDWVESLPGQGTCRRGRYVGSFGCLVSGGVVPIELEGQITFTLTGSEEEQTLHVVQGTVSDSTGIFEATLGGKLDCTQEVFTGETSDGVAYALPTEVTPVEMQGPPLFRFAASFVARFDDQTLSMAGTWTMVNDVGGGCGGLWRAAAVP
jgi:hypothetical protein